MRIFLALLLLCTPALADPPRIVSARLDGSSLSVTLLHPDSGWDHYADAWRAELPDGTVLATRVLAHPHETEQPFTRSQRIDLPPDTDYLTIRARCLVDGWSDETFRLDLD
ncbi:hypothetical protein [Frigidibacter sp. ROC022]|uniref:hypothetical protein n=1 Tax=Frigidibacter sp. ROC022 TaxID=2971796 RepID=UPI00215B4C5A|nr:hypothetical protein [Frigidibacter sp. ROC022]MCR8722744.1 hypothetical protein [Frigidibacter sp. ROC022]